MNKDRVLALGGGHPKLEAYLKPGKIEIYDFFPEVYMDLLDEFKSLYDYEGEIEYRRTRIDESFSFPDLINPANTLITFVHFLEHLSYDLTIQLLKAMPPHTDGVIYGPNAETKPMDKNWFHFSKQHLTLIPLKTFREIISDMGYNIRYDTPFGLDMLLFFNTGDKAISAKLF